MNEQKFFRRPTLWLEPEEYSKVYSEINNEYKSKFEGKYICAHVTFGIDGIVYVYWFENLGYGEYNIFFKTVDEH